MSVGLLDLGHALPQVVTATDRVTPLLRSDLDGTAPVPGLAWTAAECAVHLTTTVESLVAWLDGSADPPVVGVAGIGEVNAARIAADPERSLPVLADRLETAVGAFVELAERHGPDHRMPWYEASGIDVGTCTGVVLGELLVHGLDLARSAGRSWPIDHPPALSATAAGIDLLPLYVDRAAAAGLSARFVLRLRRGWQVGLAFRDGDLHVEHPPAGPVDCHISADPATYLLVAYGRTSQWPAILTGRISAWGRRPWLGLRLPGLFHRP